MSDPAKGILALILANLIWGLSPIFYKALAHVPPLEVLSHRTIWSLVFFGVYLAIQGRLGQIAHALAGPRALALIVLATTMISVNWFLFIWSIQVGRAIDASLGYYIFPLVSVLIGLVFFGEPLGRAKLTAFLLALIAVVVLTIGLGQLPWISVTLAVSFGVYLALKKMTPAGPVVSVTAEVALLLPMAVIWLWGIHNHGWMGISGRNLATFGNSWPDTLMLMLAGPITAGPLILFSFASKRLRLATVGLLQYLNPSLQFLVAVLVFAEPLTRWHGIAFAMIWLALAIYSVASIGQDRVARRSAIKAGTSATTVTNPASDGSAKPLSMT